MSPTDFPLYGEAIAVPIFSILSVLVCLPPLIWHVQRRNIGAASLISWFVITSTMTFLNALIWPRDNTMDWWLGYGLCDIEVRLRAIAPTAQMGATVCILNDLATLLNTTKIIVSTSPARKTRKMIRDLLVCYGLPTLIFVLFYIVQIHRYYILTIQGCVPALSLSWVTIVLLVIWPPILLLVACYFAVLVLIRMYLYRQEFTILLSTSDTTRSRFIRLLLVATLTILSSLPITILELVKTVENFAPQKLAYDWDDVHQPDAWDEIYKIPTFLQPDFRWSLWVSIMSGFCLFVFLGTGKEAMRSYERWMVKIHLGWIIEGFTAASEKFSRVVPIELFSFLGSKLRSVIKPAKSMSTTETTTSTTITSLTVPIVLETGILTSPTSTLIEASLPRPRSALRRTYDWMRLRPLSFQQVYKHGMKMDERLRQGSEAPLTASSEMKEEVPLSPWSDVGQM